MSLIAGSESGYVLIRLNLSNMPPRIEPKRTTNTTALRRPNASTLCHSFPVPVFFTKVLKLLSKSLKLSCGCPLLASCVSFDSDMTY